MENILDYYEYQNSIKLFSGTAFSMITSGSYVGHSFDGVLRNIFIYFVGFYFYSKIK